MLKSDPYLLSQKKFKHVFLNLYNHRHYKYNKSKSGFTIVELLVVIVVIGILAAITIVSYTGISSRAITSSLQSDLTNASQQLKLSQVDNGYYPVTINCAQPDSLTNKCIKSSSGNNYIDFQVDNTFSTPSFCLNSTNSNGTSYRIVNDGSPHIGNCSRPSCLSIYNSGESSGDGTYWIKPASTSFRVYCDMTNGGWTRLNNNIATSTKLFNNNDVLITNNVPGACGAPGCAFIINGISVSYSDVRINLTRTTSIVQCPGISGASIATSYWNGSSWVARGMCGWNDGIFANAVDTDMTGLKLIWKLEGSKASTGEIKFTSQCSDGNDSGQIQNTVWVK